MEMMGGENDNSNFFSEEIIIDGDIEKTLMNYITDPNDEVRQKFPAILVNLLEQQPLEETLAHIHVYISAIFVVSEDKMPAVRFNLVQQIFYIFLFCQKNYYYKLSFYLYDRLLQIILKYFHDEDPSVRREAYSTLQRVLLEKCIKDEKIIEEQICPIISQQLKQRNCQTEDEAQLLMASLVTMFRTAPLLSPEKAEKFFLDNFIELCSFKIEHIRRACARMYPIMCHVLGKEITENRLIEPFRQLCGDNCWVVRKSCAESIPLIALTVSRQCRIDKLTPLVLQLANDVSKSVFSSTFKILGEFMSTFAQPCIIGLAYTYTGDLRIINPMDSDFAELSDSELLHNYEHYSKMFSKTSLSSYLPIRHHQEQSSSQSQLSESESNLDKSFLVNGSIDDNENENDDVDDDDDDNNNNSSVDNKTITEAVTETSSLATTVPLTIKNTTTPNSSTNNTTTTTTTTADDQKNSNNDNKNNTKILTPKEIAQIIIDNREKLIKEINNESYVKRTLWTNTGAMEQFGGSSLDIFSNQTIETTTTNPPPPISLTSTITTTAIEPQAGASSTGISTMNYFGSNINDGGNNNLTGETDADVNSSLSVSSSSSASSSSSSASASATSSTSTPNFKSRRFDFSSHLVDLSLIIRRAIDENKKRNEEIKVFGSGSWGINKNNNSNSPNCGKKLRRQLRELKTAAISEDEPIWNTTSSSNSSSRIDNNFSCNKINSNCNSFNNNNNNNNDNSNNKFDNKTKEQNKSDNDENIGIENLNIEQEDKKDTVTDVIDKFTNSPKQIEIASQMSEMDNLINEYVKMEEESKKKINDDKNRDKQQDRYDNDNMDASTNENAAAVAVAAATATNAYYIDKNENENEKEKEDRESNWADQEQDWDDDVEIVYNEFVSEANKIKKFNEEKNTVNDDDNANVNVNTDSPNADQNNYVRTDTTTIIDDYTNDADDDVFKNFNSYKYWYIEPCQLSNIDDIDDELLLMKSDTEQKQQKSGIIRCNSFVSSSLSSYLSSTSNATSTTTSSSSSFLLSSTLPSRSIASITTIDGQTAIGGPMTMTTMLMTATSPNNNLTTIHNRTFTDLKKLSINFEQNIMPSCLLKTYVEMVLSYKDEEFSYNSARSFPAVALTIGKQNWHIIKPVMQYLCDDLHWKVRSIMASSIDVLATILGKEIATEDLVPIYIGFFKDIDEVKIEAIRIFSYFLKAVDIPKHDEILSNVGTCLKVDSTMNWHIKEDLAKQIFLLIKMYEPIQKHNNLLYLTSLTALFLEDKISCVREIAADALVSMIQIFDENHREAIVKIFIVEEFALSDNWRKRQTFLNIIYKLITCEPPLVHLVCMVLDNVEKLSYDSVPNIRIFVAKIVMQLKTLDRSESNILKLNSDNDKIVSEIFERLCKDKDRGVREICGSTSFDNNYEWNYELLD